MSEEVEVKLEEPDSQSESKLDAEESSGKMFSKKPRKNLRQRKPSHSDEEEKQEDEMYVSKLIIKKYAVNVIITLPAPYL